MDLNLTWHLASALMETMTVQMTRELRHCVNQVSFDEASGSKPPRDD